MVRLVPDGQYIQTARTLLEIEKMQRTRLHLRKFAISQRVVYMCDGLPAQEVVASTTMAFKTKQDACLNTERVFVCCGLDYW